MINAAKSGLRRALKSIVIFKSNEFRITAFDLIRSTRNLRDPSCSFTAYLDWRHHQIQRSKLHFLKDHPVLGDIFDSYYGKIDRIALVLCFLEGSLQAAGDVAEFGVYEGHTAAAIDKTLAQYRPDKQLYLFDSFSGMPEITHSLDKSWNKGDLASPIQNVKVLFADSPRVHIVPGFFSETLPQHQDLRFSFCHVDADLYTSIKECIDYILPRLSVGGVIVFDDYGFRDTAGAKAAIEESFSQPHPSFIPLPTGQAVYIAQPWHTAPQGTPPATSAEVP